MLRGLHNFPVVSNTNVYRGSKLEWVPWTFIIKPFSIASKHAVCSPTSFHLQSFEEATKATEITRSQVWRLWWRKTFHLACCDCSWIGLRMKEFSTVAACSEHARVDLRRHTWTHLYKQWKRKLASFCAEQAFESCFAIPPPPSIPRPRRSRMLSVCLCFSAYN